jgi:hypothetical protein
MKESEYAPIILKTIGDNGASVGTLKKACNQGNKITNIRKALYRLLKEGKIEINGYDTEFNNFSYDGIILKKVNSNYTNPIYVKGLLDYPLKDDNYFEIQRIFKKRIDLINQLYNEDIKRLSNIMDKMPLKEAIESGYITSEYVYTGFTIHKDLNDKKGEKEKLIFEDLLIEHPETEIWYLKDKFSTSLAYSYTFNTNKDSPYYFSRRPLLKYEGRHGERTFLDRYKEYFHDNLPIGSLQERQLFNHFVIGALKEKGEKKDERLWELASDLTDQILFFVKKLDILDYIHDYEWDSLSESPLTL